MGQYHKIKKMPSKKIVDIFGLQLWYTDKKFNYRGIWFTTQKSIWIYRIIPFNRFWYWFTPKK